MLHFLIKTAKAETVITADQAVRGGKTIELKKTVDDAVSRCPSVKRVFVTSRTGAKVKTTSKDIDIDKVRILNLNSVVIYSYNYLFECFRC